jgi:hypothetical protein
MVEGKQSGGGKSRLDCFPPASPAWIGRARQYDHTYWHLAFCCHWAYDTILARIFSIAGPDLFIRFGDGQSPTCDLADRHS